MDNLTPTLNEAQLKGNIDALQKAGKDNSFVQSYVNNYQRTSDGRYTLKQTQQAKPIQKQTSGGLLTPEYEASTPLGQDMAKRGADIKNTASDVIHGKISQPEAILQGAGAIAGGVGDVVKQGVSTVNDALGGLPMKIASAIIPHIIPGGKNIQDAFQSPAAQKVLSDMSNGYSSWAKANPRAAKDLESAFNVGTFAVGGEEGEPLVKSAVEGLPEAASGVAKTVGEATDAIATKGEDFSLNAEKKDWARPTTVNKPTYKTATEIYEKATDNGHDISQTLADNKIKLSDNVADKNYDTKDSAESLRTDAGKASKEILRPSLEKANSITPKTPVEEVIKEAKAEVQRNKFLTPDTKDAIKAKLDSSVASYKKAYPDGMQLTDLHDEKINSGLVTKRSPVGDVATNLEAQKNEALRDTFKTMTEQKAPEELKPLIKEFNAELTKKYRAADYLEALHGKKVPQTLLQSIASKTSKALGAAVGNAFGGVFGAVGGYHLGGALESLFENMSNPIREHFLSNLETSNPEAFAKVQEYLSKTPEERLKLPYYEAGTPENPRIVEPTKDSSVKAVPAEKTLPTRNPKTGRMQTTYTSDVKK